MAYFPGNAVVGLGAARSKRQGPSSTVITGGTSRRLFISISSLLTENGGAWALVASAGDQLSLLAHSTLEYRSSSRHLQQFADWILPKRGSLQYLNQHIDGFGVLVLVAASATVLLYFIYNSIVKWQKTCRSVSVSDGLGDFTFVPLHSVATIRQM